MRVQLVAGLAAMALFIPGAEGKPNTGKHICTGAEINQNPGLRSQAAKACLDNAVLSGGNSILVCVKGGGIFCCQILPKGGMDCEELPPEGLTRPPTHFIVPTIPNFKTMPTMSR